MDREGMNWRARIDIASVVVLGLLCVAAVNWELPCEDSTSSGAIRKCGVAAARRPSGRSTSVTPELCAFAGARLKARA
jgi:hypothetical protein